MICLDFVRIVIWRANVQNKKAAKDPYLADDGRPDFEALFREARPRMLALARRLMRSESDAEDVVQQAFISGLLHRDDFQARAQATSWMYRITYNAALMALRSKGRRVTSSFEDLPAEGAFLEAKESWATPGDPEDVAHRLKLKSALDEALTTLSPIDREIVDMRLTQDCSTKETAEALGMSASAAKARLHRARTVLQEVLRSDPAIAA